MRSRAGSQQVRDVLTARCPRMPRQVVPLARYTRPCVVKNRESIVCRPTKKWLTMSSCLRPAPCTPLPPRFWLRSTGRSWGRLASRPRDRDDDVSRAIISSRRPSPSAATMRCDGHPPCLSRSPLKARRARWRACAPAWPGFLPGRDLCLDLARCRRFAGVPGRPAAQLHVADRLGLDSSMSSRSISRPWSTSTVLRRPDEGDERSSSASSALDQAAHNVGAFVGLAQP